MVFLFVHFFDSLKAPAFAGGAQLFTMRIACHARKAMSQTQISKHPDSLPF
jgi:hypothetical protein